MLQKKQETLTKATTTWIYPRSKNASDRTSWTLRAPTMMTPDLVSNRGHRPGTTMTEAPLAAVIQGTGTGETRWTGSFLFRTGRWRSTFPWHLMLTSPGVRGHMGHGQTTQRDRRVEDRMQVRGRWLFIYFFKTFSKRCTYSYIELWSQSFILSKIGKLILDHLSCCRLVVEPVK